MTERPKTPGTSSSLIEEILRVDHAGEYGAVNIYRGQRAVFSALPGKEKMATLIEEMEAGEQHHLETFDQLLIERNVRPTVLAPIWNAAGFALGAATALAGDKAAMACTSAVEDVIEKHYGEQLEIIPQDEPELMQTIAKFREEEIEHHDTAIEHGAEQAPAYDLLKSVIGLGCKLAIKVAAKV